MGFGRLVLMSEFAMPLRRAATISLQRGVSVQCVQIKDVIMSGMAITRAVVVVALLAIYQVPHAHS